MGCCGCRGGRRWLGGREQRRNEQHERCHKQRQWFVNRLERDVRRQCRGRRRPAVAVSHRQPEQGAEHGARSAWRKGAARQFRAVPGISVADRRQGRREVDFYVDAKGASHTVSSGGSPGTGTLFSLGRVNAGAPEALSRRIARLAHLPQSKLHYMVLELDPSAGRLRWLVYPVQGATRIEYFEAAGARAPIREQLP